MALPTIFLNHGGGPFPVLGHGSQAGITKHLKGLHKSLKVEKPKAIIIATAHWESSEVKVSTNPAPGMLYDYYGFPPEAYKLQYPAPGSPEVAQRALELLRAAGIPCGADSTRGYDHGTFVPLMLAFPDADIPVVQMSLQERLDPTHHMAVGAALAPLREEGVLIIGSGMSYHNMGVFMSGGWSEGKPLDQASQSFDSWLHDAVINTRGQERHDKLAAWAQAPGGREAHPREEHLAPIWVAAGAAMAEPASADFRASTMGAQVSGFVFGGGKQC